MWVVARGIGTLEQPLHVQYTESTRVQLLRMLQRLMLVGLFAVHVAHRTESACC